MKVYRVVTVSAVEGKNPEAIKELTELRDYARAEIAPEAEYELCVNMDGTGSRISWVGKHASMADLERAISKWEADPKSKEWRKKSRELFDKVDTHYYRIMD